MIKRLIALLKSDTLRLEAEDIADALWLAGHWSQAEGPAMGAASQPEAPDAHGAARGGAAPSSSPLHSATSPGAVFAAPRGQSAQPLGASHRGRPLKTPLPPALRGRLRLGRALRPLKRTVNSAVSRVLDETASAERIASTGMMVPVLKPARERWLHVDVVFDDAASMDIWRPLILELQHLLEGSGIFRTVRTWRLAGGVQGPVCVYAGLEGRRLRGDQGRRPNEVGSAPGRQLIIVVSDCASSSWTNGDVAMVMRQWHQRSHVLVLQVLPQWLWERTALGAALPLRLAPDLSSPQRWRYTLPAEAIESRDGLRGIPIPLAGLDQASLLAWSQAFTGAQGRTVRGYLLEPDSPAYALQAELAAEQRALPAQERVERFRASASPLARRLAALLAAAPVITLPLIRMIQETLLPESTHTHCAEVLLSGLLRVVRPDVEAQEAGERLYDFVDDATRGLVLAPLPLSTSAAVFDSISRYVDQHSGHTTRNVIAALRDPDGSHELRLDEASRPFAVVSAALLRRLGGPYRGLAERLERELGAPQAPAPDQAAPPARPAASQAAEAASPQARWRRTPRVMVVEDDPATRRLYRFLLTSSGYEVTEAEDGIDAMEKHKRSPVDLIITDINMPRMGGVDLTMTLRQNQSDVYIIMVAAFSTPETEKRAFRAGVNEYLTKPFDFEELERRAEQYFKRSGLLVTLGEAAAEPPTPPQGPVSRPREDAPPGGTPEPPRQEAARPPERGRTSRKKDGGSSAARTKEREPSASDPAILLVDDEPDILIILHRLMRDLTGGYALITVDSGRDALSQFSLRTRPIPLVITDYSMPGMNGLELTAEIKKLSPSTRVIMITAYVTPELEQRAREHQVDYFLPKPFPLERLESIVREVLK